jgi:4-amino-4-deoxy-L-arabinose transferase-like glycosyltransferase
VSRDHSASLPPFQEAQDRGVVFDRADARGYAPPFLICLAALTLFRLATLAFSQTELFFDEAQYWFWSRELAFGYYSKPPLIAWIIRGATELCGQGETCIRAPSTLIHAATAMLVFATAKQLYDARTGFWSGLVYATLPGVSLSSSLISTDAPLLFFVALSLLAVVKLQASRSWRWGMMLGIGIGFGLLSKYAMSYLILCLALYAAWTRDGRALLKDARLYAALAIAALIIAPNLIWNAHHGFATLGHTADNANWGKSLFHPVEALEFIGGQFGVFGPVLFAALLVYCANWLRSPQLRAMAGEPERLLLTFTVPVLLLMATQAFLSRAHANWAAFAYVAATVLVTSILLRQGWRRLFRASLAIHLAIVLLIGIGGILAGRLALPGGTEPYARLLGWKALAETAADKARSGGFAAIATDKRALAAELLYYLRDAAIPVVALRDGGPPSDHFEMTRPLDQATPRPVLLVSFSRNGPPASEALGAADIPAGQGKPRQIFFYALREPPR